MPSKNKTLYGNNRYIWMKIRAIKYLGGKCSKCGYSRCYAALEFHHRDPDEKELEWNKLRKRAWSSIKEELDKCDLLCANCHREVHFDPSIIRRVKEWFLRKREFSRRIRERRELKSECSVCGKEFHPTSSSKRDSRITKYCSPECGFASQEKIQWPENLPEMIERHSKRYVAMKLGVSDKAVAKRLKNHH